MFAYPCSGKTTLGRLVGCMWKDPALSEAGVRVASGATKLVPAILSGLAQCRKQCPLIIRAKVLHVLRRFLRLPLAPPGIDENAGCPVDVDGIFIQRIE